MLPDGESENDRIVLGLLNSVEQDGARSQRHFAAELGIALGLVNAYLNRCISKGLVKASQAPARRYAYYLTPKGFAEKTRLTVDYLSSSFGFFRQAKADCTTAFQAAKQRNCQRLAMLGVSDLAEIATICALESDIVLVAIVDPASRLDRYVGLPVVSDFAAIEGEVDGILVTALTPSPALERLFKDAITIFGSEAVFMPQLINWQRRKSAQGIKS